ncbi:MAG: hypothetical protein EA398_17910 [Deltaproteobacteria bacterium]|nr:MAG: hypothetical protein EA398_17910 [Deltaproteobacteria bacterium]
MREHPTSRSLRRGATILLGLLLGGLLPLGIAAEGPPCEDGSCPQPPEADPGAEAPRADEPAFDPERDLAEWPPLGSALWRLDVPDTIARDPGLAQPERDALLEALADREVYLQFRDDGVLFWLSRGGGRYGVHQLAWHAPPGERERVAVTLPGEGWAMRDMMLCRVDSARIEPCGGAAGLALRREAPAPFGAFPSHLRFTHVPVIHGTLPDLRACSREAMLRGAGHAGTMTLEFLLSPPAAVARSIAEDTVGDETLRACILDVLERAEFPQLFVESEVRMNYVLRFPIP